MRYNQNKNKNKVSTSIIKNRMKFLSWNIQAPSSVEGSKFEIDSFKNIILQHDFVCLQEVRQDIHFPGYRRKCITRKDKASGGVGIFMKRELFEGVEMSNIKEGSDYIICKLRKQFYKQDNDIYLVNVYARPYNTSCSTEQNSGKDIINKVEEVINNLQEEGDVIVCGDFNARIARKSGSVVNDSDTFLPMPDDYIPDNNIPRQSQDNGTNSHGSHFLNLIINNQLTILNGRTLGDSSGKFTSIQKQGCSVVDYFAVSNSIKYIVNYMKVLDLTEHSDHKPLSLELECKPMNINPSEPLSAIYQPAPLRFIFNVENKDKFQQSQSNESSRSLFQSLNITIDNIVSSNGDALDQSLNITIDNIVSSNGDALDQSKITSTVIDTNNKFTEHLRDIAANCFKQTKNNKKGNLTNHGSTGKQDLVNEN